MDAESLIKLLEQVAAGSLEVEQARSALTQLPFEDLGYARIDHHRQRRQGIPEVVFGENKTSEQVIGIVGSLLKVSDAVLVTRIDPAKAQEITQALPQLTYKVQARTLSWKKKDMPAVFARPVAVVCAGTSDLDVAEEAIETLEIFGEQVARFYDVGVAGIHRLFDALPEIEKAPAVICVAGMEGALPSVLGGLVKSPVIAVPTSVGYGAALGGLGALMGMLTSCASGLSVVNIDNGFGAAMAVLRMRNLLSEVEK